MQQNMPPMGNMPSMGNTAMDMHDTFWRDDQVMIMFYSPDSHIQDGNLNTNQLLQNLNLSAQLQQISDFLNSQLDPNNQGPIKLAFLDDRENLSLSLEGSRSASEDNAGASPNLPRGVHLFGLNEPIKKDFGEIKTCIPGFFHVIKEPVLCNPKDQNNRTIIPAIVNTLNQGIAHLNGNAVPIAFATPTWLCGGSQIGEGCPLTPPAPMSDACSDWHVEVPDIDTHSELGSKTGKNVKVFVVDALPERAIIANAAQNAGNTNGLLHNVNETATFDYSQMSSVQGMLLAQHTNCAAVGKDVYGEHFPMLISDHGLFVAGIVRDIARDADIECIRVLNDFCMGDMQTLMSALWKIYKRKLEGDLRDTPVVINMSLVIPTDTQAQNSGITLGTDHFDNVLEEGVFQILKCLADTGVVITASAGNEGDGREMTTGPNRPGALRPASLSESIDNIIAVGAVTKNGAATTYSCYPGSHSIGAWGGELPNAQAGEVVPPNPTDAGSNHPTVKFSDAVRGIYSNILYPPLSAVPANPPEQYYTSPNSGGWAYWVGTSFATPIVSAAAARILQWKKENSSITDSVYDILQSLIAKNQPVNWNNLNPADFPGGVKQGPLLRAEQKCRS